MVGCRWSCGDLSRWWCRRLLATLFLGVGCVACVDRPRFGFGLVSYVVCFVVDPSLGPLCDFLGDTSIAVMCCAKMLCCCHAGFCVCTTFWIYLEYFCRTLVEFAALACCLRCECGSEYSPNRKKHVGEKFSSKQGDFPCVQVLVQLQ